MLPIPKIYNLWPSVVPADQISSITVCAAEPAFLPLNGEEFTLKIVPINSDENYYKPEKQKTLSVTAKEGLLRFDCLFEGEQEHLIQLIRDDKVLQSFSLFSLYEDLYALTPLKGDLHSHSFRSDGSHDPASQAGYYREQGYDFAALTDHNRFFSGEEIDRFYEGVSTGFVRISGEEIHCPGSPIHIVHVGGRESVASRYVKHRGEYETQIEAYLQKVPETVPEEFRSRYAKAMWATDAIHSAGGLAIFPHPFWRPHSFSYNVCDPFAKLLMKSGMFDAYEIIGGMTQPNINRSVAFWSDLRAEGLNLGVVGSSDAHELNIRFPDYFTVCFAKEKQADAILAAIKNGRCVAVEAVGCESDRQYRCYGTTRFVTYANFLLNHYFPDLQRVTAGAGVAMRAYAMEDADARLVEKMTEMAEKFTDRFFGKCPPPRPSQKLLRLEEALREIQLTEGPLTKGSAVDIKPAPRLI